MNPARRISRLERQAVGVPAIPDPQQGEWSGGALNAPADEAQGLAREIAGAFGTLVDQYREYYKLTAHEAVSRASDRTPEASSSTA